jgi:hypothetical protein
MASYDRFLGADLKGAAEAENFRLTVFPRFEVQQGGKEPEKNA